MKISNEFYQRLLAIINFLRIFPTRGIKNLKKLANFFKFQSFPSVPSVAGDKKQFQYFQTVFNNKSISLVLELD